jgi:hypothetical protein
MFFLDVEGINKKGEQDYNSQIYGVSIRCSLYEYPRSSHDFPISSLMIPIIPFFFTVTMNPHIFNGEVPILPKKDANKKVPTLEKGTHPFPIPFPSLSALLAREKPWFFVLRVLVFVTTTGRQLRGLDPRLAGISNGLAGVVTPWLVGTPHMRKRYAKIGNKYEKMEQKNRLVILNQQKEGVGVVL